MLVNPGFQLASGCHIGRVGASQAEQNIPLSGCQPYLLIM